MRRKTTEEIIELARKEHGDFYIYDKTVYKNKRTKITVTCPIHGDFTQYPFDHIRGCGCNKCADIRRRNSHLKSREKFIEDARKIHGDKYIYDEYIYQGSTIDGIIICPIHRRFTQSPQHHLLGC